MSSASDYQQSDTSERSGFVVDAVSDDVGKGVFATRDFLAGETIFRERPLVSAQFCWNAHYGYRCCHFCMEPLETAQENVQRLANDANIVLPHGDCCATRAGFHCECPNCGVRFCSETCMEEAYRAWHKTLCLRSRDPDPAHPLLNLITIWQSFHYPPESTSITLIMRILASIAQADNPEELIANYMSFMHDASNQKSDFTHKMLGPEFSAQLEQLRLAALQAFPQPCVQPLLTPDGFQSLFALIGRNGQGVATSPFSAWLKKTEKIRMRPEERAAHDDLVEKVYSAVEAHVGCCFMDNEGSGLFFLQSHLNHSCQPNAVVEFPFNSHELVVNARTRIAPGEQIVISYLDENDVERSRHSRQKSLRENYLFACMCSKCEAQAQDPDETSEEEMSDEDEEDQEEEEADNNDDDESGNER